MDPESRRLGDEHSKRTAETTRDRVAADLAHQAYPELAAALRARIQPILDRWRRLSVEAMPHLDTLSQEEFENTIGKILSAAADALESADPAKLYGVIEHGPGHGIDRFLQRFSLLDLFEEVRILRGVVVVEMAAEMGRAQTVAEAASFHAIFDVIIQQGVMRLVEKQGAEAKAWHTALRDRAERLEHSNADLLQFASAASHDLKEPLRGIATLARIIRDDDAGLNQTSRQRLERIGVLCERLSRMVAGLIEHARTGLEPKLEPCDLGAMIGRIIDNSREELAFQNAVVEVKGGAGGGAGGEEGGAEAAMPTVLADCALMERVFANLIANGIKFNQSPVKRVEISWDGERGGEGAVAVRDNGIGIEERHRGKLFTLFKRLHSAEQFPGEGLGLALARRIVEAHGGRIEFESAGVPGRGTTFYVMLPRAREEPRA